MQTLSAQISQRLIQEATEQILTKREIKYVKKLKKEEKADYDEKEMVNEKGNNKFENEEMIEDKKAKVT